MWELRRPSPYRVGSLAQEGSATPAAGAGWGGQGSLPEMLGSLHQAPARAGGCSEPPNLTTAGLASGSILFFSAPFSFGFT